MADPATILGVFTGTLQIISFTRELISLTQEIAHTGSSDHDLKEKSEDLLDVSQNLQKSLSTLDSESAGVCTEEQQQLQKAAQQCLIAARAMLDELDRIDWRTNTVDSGLRHYLNSAIFRLKKTLGVKELEASSSSIKDNETSPPLTLRSKKHPMVRALRKLVKRSKLEDLERNMKRAEDTLQTSILQKLLSDSRSAAEDKTAAETKLKRDEILQSLAFPDLNSRRDHVSESHEKTLGWIFSSKKHGKWDSFVEWLGSSERIYWIEGKPGSGKSTLMKLLVRDERTRQGLRSWSGHPIILSHFLWISGTKDQRSLHKLLCSLVYQLLKEEQGLVDQLIPHCSFLDNRSRQSRADEWSTAELRQVLSKALHILNKRVCVFLDGLDEIDSDDRVEFHRVLKDLLQAEPEIKLCVASRPEVQLEVILKRVLPKLRLEDLNRDDISATVRDFLEDFSLFDTGVQTSDKEAIREKIINLVIDRSEGVFLWVHLVLRRIHNGRETIGTLDEVLRRIEKLPQGVENLYKETWKRHGDNEDDYREEAAQYFQLVMQWNELPSADSLAMHRRTFTNSGFTFNPEWRESLDSNPSLFNIAVASMDSLRRDFLIDKGTLVLGELLTAINNTRQRIQLCCGGLLEIRDTEAPDEWAPNLVEPSSWFRGLLMPLSVFFSPDKGSKEQVLPPARDLINLWETVFCTQVVFIHRTARDFLLDKPLGRTIMGSCPLTNHQLHTKLVQSLISRYLVYGTWNFHFVEERVHTLKKATNCFFETEQSELLRLIDEMPSRLLDRYRVITAILHNSILDLRQSTGGGTWSIELDAASVQSLNLWWFSMRRTIPITFDIVYQLIFREARYGASNKWEPWSLQPEDPDRLTIMLVKILYECTASGIQHSNKRPNDTERFCAAGWESNGIQNSAIYLYDHAALEKLIWKIMRSKTVLLDSRINFVVRLSRHSSFGATVWGCPDYDDVNSNADVDEIVIECNIAQLIRFAQCVIKAHSTPADDGKTRMTNQAKGYGRARDYDDARANLERHPVYRKVILVTRRHQSSGIDNVSVSPSGSQSEAICSLLENKNGTLLWQELAVQLDTILQAETSMTSADAHKWLADHRAFPFNWSETGDLYNRMFKQDVAGPIIDELLMREV
ncbi:uncharacterized protein NCU08537 [Neurospora crassa OR74A]|uniref:NACHT domain-containing protein n=1 Tax=Neurospora crassa (strain ATCC 24698 / 74-OR23-1A / CBS 708.71 / DSM 1257 / FGSC 987) TaxID=367110 RepID=U9W3T6_NEUCR|nr:hypothetical protein NCU08537 [Neurospora crassa OR74A]XP_011393958.1 uncharacterized protein NCU08537 [Neurospora crassa OR74A]ESA43457.1 hypothetical protein NCU08537 [Neurospora crassa OR74A]ESA43458.1 hypothetical protein, variant [Neurospora crassa OR74A]|eukprot:XP_011393957.1 hypothetical protein NCU08537 [Neurospora crassa OR74A]